jgi:precorrin-6A/cobalt-precorrin-6A reductase
VLNVLILGGTAEANALARALVNHQRIAPILSLAGRTQNPKLPPIPYRIGGFGGVEGLATYLIAHKIDRLVDATHPFAANISRNAVHAANATGTERLIIRRPAWQRTPQDCWIDVTCMQNAAASLGATPRRVFLAVGRQDLEPFRPLPHHYVIRSVEAPASPPQNATIITARGPFDLESERKLLLEHRIDVVVTKNSGGITGDKLLAARALQLPVIMVARPEKPAGPSVADHLGALAWLHDTDRGV